MSPLRRLGVGEEEWSRAYLFRVLLHVLLGYILLCKRLCSNKYFLRLHNALWLDADPSFDKITVISTSRGL